MRKYVCLISVFLLFSCSSEKSSSLNSGTSGSQTKSVVNGVGESEYSLELLPKDAVKNVIFRLNSKGFELANAKIEWLINGDTIVNPKPYKFEATEIKKGDIVQVITTLKEKKIFSNAVRIKNTPPQIDKATLTPEFFNPGDKLGVDVIGKDVDGDAVIFFYEWTKNGQPAGTSNKIDSTMKRGDKISVKITPFDGESYGPSGVIDLGIANFPPSIMPTDCDNKGNIYTCYVKAIDPDGDALTYSLKGAPQGMTIDKSTGLVKWGKPVDYKGKVSFAVSVADSYGGETTQELILEVD